MKRYLWLEWLTLFAGMPVVILCVHQRFLMVALLWGGALFAYGTLKRNADFSHRSEWNMAGLRAGLRPVLLRFVVLAALLALFTTVTEPDRLFALPRRSLALWALIMLLYPILSVWPQEIIFRSFFYHRYASLFGTHRHYIAASALAFGFAHIVFANWIVVVFTCIGGAMFAGTYARRRSLALACLEHALYGCFIFTIGLGWYFYGAAWHPKV